MNQKKMINCSLNNQFNWQDKIQENFLDQITGRVLIVSINCINRQLLRIRISIQSTTISTFHSQIKIIRRTFTI
ncbi:unnamed protein product [Paramecium pentaurelia]|uniref:Uncharacterized protein n=1 Tax=Paramecium pentaurelia TaxID=43138 RepID=A0A8S1U7M3_9CILI|nr:unnamed protein product [Paramecium pentaurelia]CAD8160718.1 unnamed protein product [Paramecium pentaurelia]